MYQKEVSIKQINRNICLNRQFSTTLYIMQKYTATKKLYIDIKFKIGTVSRSVTWIRYQRIIIYIHINIFSDFVEIPYNAARSIWKLNDV